MTVALIKLASPGPVSDRVGRAIGVFPYMLIRENLYCYAARVNQVRMVSNFAQGDYLPKGTKLSSGLTKNTKFIFCLPAYCTICVILVSAKRSYWPYSSRTRSHYHPTHFTPTHFNLAQSAARNNNNKMPGRAAGITGINLVS